MKIATFPRPGVPQFTVYVDDNFHFVDEDERTVCGRFDHYSDAVGRCRAIVDQFLEENWKPAMSPGELYMMYESFGDDPWISPDPRKEALRNSGKSSGDWKALVAECLASEEYLAGSFSAWAYAEKRAQEVCASKERMNQLFGLGLQETTVQPV